MRWRTIVVVLDGPATGYGGTGDDAEASSIQRGGDEFRRASFGLPVSHTRGLCLLCDLLSARSARATG